jgi:Glycosyltransferase like family
VNVAYGVCVGSWDRFQANVLPHSNGQPVLALSGQPTIAVAYNSILDAAIGMGADVLILQHDDLEIVDPAGEAKIVDALSSTDVGIVGVAGGVNPGAISWWAYRPIGHQKTDVSQIALGGSRAGEVDILEGSLLAIHKRAFSGIRFDTSYPGFHGYDVDISMQIGALDLKVLVADIDTWHHTAMGFKSAQSHQDWLKADELFRAKWCAS